MDSGNALTWYKPQFAASILAADRPKALADQLIGALSSVASQFDTWTNVPYRTRHVEISTNTHSSSNSWQAAVSTSPYAIPIATGQLSLQSHAPIVKITRLLPDSERASLALILSSSEEHDLSISNPLTWDCRPSDFAQIDIDRERKAEAESDRAVDLLPAALGTSIRQRLYSLMAIARDEGIETAAPSPDSIRAAVNFLAAVSADIYPDITLDSEGLVWLEWRDASGNSAVLRCLPDGAIAYSLATRAAGRVSRRNSWAGIVNAEELQRTILAQPLLAKLLRRAT